MPTVLASDIRKRYQKKNNNKNKKKEKATNKKVASSSSTTKPAVKGVQAKQKNTTPSKNKPALKSGKAKSSVDKVGKAAGYALGIAPKNQRNARDIQQYQKAKDEYRDYRDSSVRKSYELRRKNTGEYANKVNRAHVRGFSYDNNPDNQSYFLKQAAAGAWSVPEGIGKAVESLSSDAAKGEQAKLNPRGGRYSQNVLDVRDRARKNNQLNGDRYERFTEELNKDPRAGTLASQVAQGAGRLAVTAPLYAIPGGAALANIGKINKATKAISTLAKPMASAGAAVNTAAYYGERYDEAIKNGATPEQARKAALAYALPTAYLEGMGGAEKALSKALKPGVNPLKTAIKSGLSEGVEEVAQTPWEEYTKKAYGANIPLFGKGNQEAVFNPNQLANAFTVGSILGAAGGGVAGIRTNTEINTYKNAVREDIKRQAGEWEEGIRKALKAGAITNEEAAASRKTISDLVKRRTAEAMAEIDNRVKKSLDANDNTEVAAYANTNDEDGYSYNANDAAGETDSQIDGGYDYGNAVEPPKIETQPVQEENNDDLMDEEERLYGEQEFGIKPRSKRKQEKTFTSEQPNVRLRGGTETLMDIQQNEGRADLYDMIRERVENEDPDFILTNSQTDKWAELNAIKNLKEYGTLQRSYAEVARQIDKNGNRGNKIIDAELALLAKEADEAGDMMTLMNVYRLHTTLGTEAARELQGRRMMRLLSPTGKAMVQTMDMERKAEKSVGFNAVEIKEDIEGNKADDVRQMFIDFAEDNNITDDNKTKGVVTDNFTLKNRIRKAKEKRIIKKANINNNQQGEIFTDINTANVRKMVGQALKENPQAFEEALQNNKIDDACFALAKQIARSISPETDVDIQADIFNIIHEDIVQRMRKYREKKLKELIKNTGRAEKGDKRKSDFLLRLIEYNNLGLLDDAKTANAVYKAMTVPVIESQEINSMIKIHELADQIKNGQVSKIDYNDDYGIKAKQVDLLNKRLDNGDTDYVVNALEQLAKKIPEDKLVGNAWQKMRQWQITAMLLNPRTVMRNFTPNAAMLAVNQPGRVGGAIADKIVSKKTGTRLYGNPVNPKQGFKYFKEGARNAWDDLLLGIDTSQNNKTELETRHAFSNNTKVGSAINKATDAMSFGLKIGDMPFENFYRNQAEQRMAELNNLDEPTELMKELAQEEAMQATFKDENKFTDITQSFVDALNKAGGGKGTYGIGSILIPFVRTPANLTKLMFDYAPPTAIAESVIAYNKFKNAVDMDEKLRLQYKFANTVSHAVSGTLLTFFMALLKEANLIEITGGDDEDDWQKTQYENQVHGKQEYAIRILDHWYNYSNLQPIGSLMALAVDTSDYLFHPQDKGLTGVDESNLVGRLLWGTLNGLVNAGEMLYESSVYKGIGDLFKGKDSIASAIAGAAASIPQQMTPALLQQTAKVIDPWQRDTTSSINDPVFRTLSEGRNKLMASMPGLSYLLPQKTDAYGLPMERFDGNTVGDIFNAFVNPFTTTKDKEGNFSGLDKKTADAYAESIKYIEKLDSMFPDKDIIPRNSDRKIKINGEYVRLTGDERQQWQKDTGGQLLKDVTNLLKTKDFNSLSEAQQADVISKALGAYKEQAKHNFAEKRGLEHTIDEAYAKPLGAADVDQTAGEYYTQIKKMNDAFMPEDERDEGQEHFTKADYKRYYAFKKFDDGEWNEDQVVYYLKAADVLSEKWEGEMDAAEEQGISKINFLKAKEEMTTLSNDRDLETKERDLMAYNIAMEYGENDEQRQWILTTLSNMGYWMQSNGTKDVVFDGSGEEMIAALSDTSESAWAGTSKKCAGIAAKDIFDSPQQFVMAINKVGEMTDSNKKDDKVAAIDQFNLTANQKKAVLAACNNQSKDVTFHDGGSIEISSEVSTVKKPTLNTDSSAKKSKETTTSSKPATTATATKTAGTIASQIRQLQNASRGFSSALSSVAQRTGEKMKSTIESIMPTKPTTYEGASKTSGFGPRESPGGIGSTNHKGVDIGVDRLTDVGAVAFVPGTIAYVGKRGGLGNVVEYLADDGNYITLAHLDSIAKGLKAGDKVSSGTQVGIVGNTGTTTGICLHVEVRPGGTRDSDPVDPETVYDLFGDGIKTPSADSNYQANSAYSSSSSSSSSSDSSSGSSGSGRSGGGSSKKKRKPISTGSSYGSYSYGGYTPSSSYSSGYTPGSYTPGSYNP